MQNEMDDMISRWKSSRTGSETKPDVGKLIEAASRKKQSSQNFHYGNILVLTIVVITLLLFFKYLFPFQDTLSRIGVALMVGGLIVRIVLEIYSSFRSSRIDLASTTLETTQSTIAFFKFRKKIHGPVTLTIVALYTVGYYILTPEFLRHIGNIIYLFDVIYVLGAAFLIWQIRKGIKKEMKDLEEMISIKRQLD